MELLSILMRSQMNLNMGKVRQGPAFPKRADDTHKTDEEKRMELRKQVSLERTEVKAPTKEEQKETALNSASLTGTAAFTIEDALKLYGVDGSEEELAALREKGLSSEVDLDALDKALSKISKYRLDKAAQQPQQIIEMMASQYSVMKDRIRKHFGGAQRDEKLEALDKVMDKHVERYAKSLSEAVGGFYEKHGISGEKARMYQSVKDGVYCLSEDYDGFIGRNSGFAQIPKGDEWLENCGDYMASQLRGAYAREDGSFRTGSGSYNMFQIGEAASLVMAAGMIAKSEKAGPVSEEELGIRLGSMAVKGMSVTDGSRALNGHKQAFLSSIGVSMDEILDESDRQITALREDTRLEASYPPLNRKAVASLVGTMVNTYGSTGSIKEALEAGIQRGCRMFKEKENPNGEIERYRKSQYWNEMFSSLSRKYRAKSTLEKIMDGFQVFLPATLSLEGLFGTSLDRKA